MTFTKQIFPETIENIDLNIAYAYPEENKAFLRTNMVSSIDGAISIDGHAHGLSNETDKKIYRAMRNLADVILVGARTMRIEKYKPAAIDEKNQALRILRGQMSIPPVALVSMSGLFDWDLPFFKDAKVKPFIFTSDEGFNVASEGKDLAEIIKCGKDKVDLHKVIEELSSRGLNKILCEGGPTLNAHLLSAGLIDELCLTISPMIVQGNEARIFDGPKFDTPVGFIPGNIFVEENNIFTRYRKV